MIPSPIASPSTWWNIGRVGGVGVAPVDLAGHDHEDRRRLRLHRPDLHRRGVGAQQHLGVRLHVEGVLEHPRRVPGRVVERGEVVVVVLDLGPLDHPVAEADHHVLDLPRRAGDQVQVPGRARRRAGQGDVDPVARQPRSSSARVELGGAPLEQLLQRLARPVGAAADLAPFLLGQLGDAAQDRRQLGFAAEVADPQLLQLGGARRGLDRGRGLRLDLLDPLEHRSAASCMAGDDIRSQAIAAAAATLSDSAPPGAAGSSPAARTPPAPRRAAPRARRRGRGSPRRASASRPLAAVGDQRRPRPRRRLDLRPAAAAGRRPSPCSPAPPSARRDRRSRARARRRRRAARARCGRSRRRCPGRRRRAGRRRAASPRSPRPAARRRSPASPSRAPRPRPAAPARPPRRRGRCRRR